MSRLCAKPTCSDPAVRWFDILAAERRVVERSGPTPSTIPLCDPHAARFSAPVGWTIDTDIHSAPSPSTLPAPIPESGADSPSRVTTALTGSGSDSSRRRKHDRDAPWFLAGSSSSESPASVAPLLPADDVHTDDAIPTAGSLLHRAFHGPDRDADIARAKSADRDSAVSAVGEDDVQVAEVGDLTTRRAKQTEPDGYDIELPFPPFEPARHVAVS